MSHVLRLVMLVLSRLLVIIVNFVLALLVIVLPLSTAVPVWVWLPLAIIDIALIVTQFRVKPVGRGITIGLVGMIAVTIVGIVASQIFAATPPIVDQNGQPMPGSIAALEKITLNGSEQWITLRGHDVTKPVLLHLGMGGPGGGGFGTRSLFTRLEKDFVVVAWDEPGTGKSYHAVPFDQLTPQRFIDDAHALTLYLRERFHQDRIYLYGTSWTSILGIWLIQRYPELYYAYIGSAQMVKTTENDVMGYDLAVKYLMDQGDVGASEALRRNGPPPYTDADMVNKYVLLFDTLNDYMHSIRFAIAVPLVPFMAPEYGMVDKVNHTLGLIDSFRTVYPQLIDVDFTKQATQLQVPVYMFVGRDDVNAMTSLVEEYYNQLDAPIKKLTWLEGGHGLNGENLPQFIDVVLNTVLPETYPRH
ncbi:MAG: alpha/beta hydrolase [Anaerolineae bacterium]